MGLLTLFAWVLLDPAWMSPRPRSLGKALLAWAFLIGFAYALIWFRIPVLVAIGSWITRITLRHIYLIRDDKPDFSLNPQGVSGWNGLSFSTIPWSDVSRVTVYDKTIFILGPKAGSRRLLGLLPPKRPCIMYSQLFFETRNADILLAIHRVQPDLEVSGIR